MSTRVSVKVLRTVSELEEIRAWWESWPGHPQSDMRLFLAVLAASSEDVRPHVIVAYREGKPDAVLVGRIDSTKFPFRIGYWRSAGPRVRQLTFVVGAQRGNCSPQASELLFRKALTCLGQGEVDVVRLAYVPIDSALYRLARSYPGLLGRDHGVVSVPHWTMELPKTYDEVLKSFSGDFRKQLKRTGKKIEAEVGEVGLKCFEKPEDLEVMVSDVECVAAKSYQRRIGTGFNDSRFKRELLLAQARHGSLLTYVMYVKGSPAAFWMGSLHNDIYYSDYMAFDPVLSKYSPGTLLQAKVLEDLCFRHVRGIDLGTGDFLYKQRLGTNRYEEADIYVFPLTFFGLALSSVRTLSVLVNEASKAALNRLGVLAKVKAAWGKKRQGDSGEGMREQRSTTP